MGIGAAYVYVSRRTKTAVQEIPFFGASIGDIWATEVYYNFEVTPWFHLTPSLQVVQSENKHTEPSMIVGLRAVLEL
jgi:porin